MYETVAWALACQGGQFQRIRIQRGVAGPEDVTFDVKYCGVCHRQLFSGVPAIVGTACPRSFGPLYVGS